MHAADIVEPAAVVIAAGVCGRMAAATAVATLPAFPGVSIRGRIAVALALTAVALPAAMRESAEVGPWPLVVAGECLVGGVIGMAIALVVGAAGWAGTLLGSASGLSWADDFDPTGEEQGSAGIGRLAWWVGAAAFLAAGGQMAVVAGLLESFEAMPIGTVLVGGGFPERLVAIATTAPTVALSLALTLSLPALAAVIAFHLASAICLRTVPFSPGAGLLQGLAAIVLLAALGFGLDAFAGTSGTLMHAALEKLLG